MPTNFNDQAHKLFSEWANKIKITDSEKNFGLIYAAFINGCKQMKKTAKDGAQRKREHDQRQREQGRKPVQIWLTDDEAKAVRQFVKELRKT